MYKMWVVSSSYECKNFMLCIVKKNFGLLIRQDEVPSNKPKFYLTAFTLEMYIEKVDDIHGENILKIGKI